MQKKRKKNQTNQATTKQSTYATYKNLKKKRIFLLHISVHAIDIPIDTIFSQQINE